MGFRSTIATFDFSGVKLPKCFRDKYANDFNFRVPSHNRKGKIPTLFLSSKYEIKTYGIGMDLPIDIQRVLREKDVEQFVIVWLHECGGITRVQIEKERIVYTEPSGWNVVDEITHNYCYGCSDADKDKP